MKHNKMHLGGGGGGGCRGGCSVMCINVILINVQNSLLLSR